MEYKAPSIVFKINVNPNYSVLTSIYCFQYIPPSTVVNINLHLFPTMPLSKACCFPIILNIFSVPSQFDMNVVYNYNSELQPQTTSLFHSSALQDVPCV